MIHDVIIPQVGESINEVYMGDWLKKSGDVVNKGEVLVEVETQKTNFELEAEVAGKLEIIHGEAGEEVPVNTVVARIDDSIKPEAGASSTDSKESTKKESSASNSSSSKSSPAAQASAPASAGGSASARNLSRDKIAQTRGNGGAPMVQGPTFDKDELMAEIFDPFPYSYPIDENRGDQVKRAPRMRIHIAENLKRSQRTAASLTTFNEVDMSAVIAARNEYKAKFQDKHGLKLGFVGFFAMAAKKALQEYPMVNSLFMGDKLLSRDYVDISVAVSTEKGLVVPVIRNVDKMDLAGFEKALSDVAAKARDGKLSIPDMEGGTFTISNGGVFGSLLSSPIINMPQSAILGLHATKKRPVVLDDDSIVARPMMYLALSYDHRIIDGKEAVQFLVSIKNSIENVNDLIDWKALV